MRSLLAVLTMLVTMAAGAQTGTFAIDIPAQPVASAITRFTEQTGIQITAVAGQIRNQTTKALKGNYTVEETLSRLLANTGLTYTIIDRHTVVIQSKDVGKVVTGAALTSSQNPAQPIQLTQVTEKAQEMPAAAVQVSQGTGMVSGRVTDVSSGAGLKGALVKVEPSGQAVSTDDLGMFRLPAPLASGSYMLKVSYLGFNETSRSFVLQKDENLTMEFALNGAQELVVYGSRSARAQALNQERMAENSSTVLSADLLGDFTGQTISEALRRAPGVSFQRDPFTGEGSNIIIRGMEPDMNAIKLNGIELPEGSGTGRSANLSNFLTESVSSITIHKTLMANQDSAGSGGLVEIETMSPLDRAHRFLSYTAEAAQRGGGFNDEYAMSMVASGTFGEERALGLGISVQYRDRGIKRVGYSSSLQTGQYLPLQVDGTPTLTSRGRVDPRRAFPFEPNATDVYPGTFISNFDSTDGSNIAVTVSSAWQPAAHTTLKLDYQRSAVEEEQFRRTSTLFIASTYVLRPVVALGGEQRRALAFGGNATLTSDYNYKPDQRTATDVLSFQGKTHLYRWDFNYLLGYTEGKTRDTYAQLFQSNNFVAVNPSFIRADAVDPTEGRVVTVYPRRTGNEVPVPLLTQAGFDFFNDSANYGFGQASYGRNDGRNHREVAELGAKYNIDSAHLKYLEAGVDYKASKFTSIPIDQINYFFADFASPTLASLGLNFDEPLLGDIGIHNGFSVLSKAPLRGFLNGLYGASLPYDPATAGDFPAGTLFNNVRDFSAEGFNSQFTREAEVAPYIQARLDIGRLEIIGGARLSRFDIEAHYIRAPQIFDETGAWDAEFSDRNRSLAAESVVQDKLLPRLLMNYRQSDNLIFRGGYFLAIARPQISLLSQFSSVSLQLAPQFGPEENKPQLYVGKGNPDLEPAKTHSLDASVEYYDNRIGVMELSVFYKRIDNLLENNVSQGVGGLSDVTLPDDPRFQDVLDHPENYIIEVSLPENNDSSASLWGIEASIEKQFTFLPGIWSGLGVLANYTYSDSKKQQPFDWSYSPVVDGTGAVTGYRQERIIFSDVPFNNQPRHSGTFGITYNQYGFDVNLAFTAQGRRQTSFDGYGLSTYEEAFKTLDFRAEYRFADTRYGRYRAFIEGADLLRGSHDPSLETTLGGKYYNGGQFFGGRQLRAGFTGSF